MRSRSLWVGADNPVRAGHAACWYSWRMLPSRSRRRMWSVGLAAEEGGPGLVIALRGGFDPLLFEDFPHGGGRDRDAEHGEFAVDAPVAQHARRIAKPVFLSPTGR